MARVGVVAVSLLAVVLLGGFLPRPAAAAEHAHLSALPKSLDVTVSHKTGEVVHAGDGILKVTWILNSTAAGSDTGFKNVKVTLCYAAVSQKDRGWRKTEDNLKKDKQCQFKVTEQPYAAGAAAASFDYTVKREIPTATYFVRAYALDAAGKEVAYGQSAPDAAFNVAGITGIHASLKVAAAVFSAFSVASLAFFFVIENRKKNK